MKEFRVKVLLVNKNMCKGVVCRSCVWGRVVRGKVVSEKKGYGTGVDINILHE